MSYLSRFKILTKILAVILLMPAVAVGIAALGVGSLKSLNANADAMNKASPRALLAARANRNIGA